MTLLCEKPAELNPGDSTITGHASRPPDIVLHKLPSCRPIEFARAFMQIDLCTKDFALCQSAVISSGDSATPAHASKPPGSLSYTLHSCRLTKNMRVFVQIDSCRLRLPRANEQQ